jgi:hypothetical protein
MAGKLKEKRIDHYDPLQCQTRPHLSYMVCFEDADARAAKGEQQTHCLRCARWRWDDQLCAEGRAGGTQTSAEFLSANPDVIQ